MSQNFKTFFFFFHVPFLHANSRRLLIRVLGLCGKALVAGGLQE